MAGNDRETPETGVEDSPSSDGSRDVAPTASTAPPASSRLTAGQLFFGGLFLLGVGGAIVLSDPNPTGAANLLVRVVLGLGAALVAGVIPGQLGVEAPFVRAGGAIGVFAIIMIFTPKAFDADPGDVATALQRADSARVDEFVADISSPAGSDTSHVVVDASVLGNLDAATASAVGAIVDSLGTVSSTGQLSISKAVLQRELQAAPAFRTQALAVRADTLYQIARTTRGITRKRLLWIDDRPAGNESLVEIFESMGMDVELATTDGEARQALAAGAYDVVISDLARGRTADAGAGFLNALRGTPHPPFVFYVGVATEARTPAGAFGITSAPDKLVDLVLAAIKTGG